MSREETVSWNTLCLLLTHNIQYHEENKARKTFFEFSNFKTTGDLGKKLQNSEPP